MSGSGWRVSINTVRALICDVPRRANTFHSPGGNVPQTISFDDSNCLNGVSAEEARNPQTSAPAAGSPFTVTRMAA